LGYDDIAAIIAAWNPHPSNYMPLLVDPNDSFGICMYAAMQLQFRFLGVVASAAAREWMLTNWMSLLTLDKEVSVQLVCLNVKC